MSAGPRDELKAAVMKALRDEPVDVHDPDNWKWVAGLEWPKPVAVISPEPVLGANDKLPDKAELEPSGRYDHPDPIKQYFKYLAWTVAVLALLTLLNSIGVLK